jgi:hypothetical protein
MVKRMVAKGHRLGQAYIYILVQLGKTSFLV